MAPERRVEPGLWIYVHISVSEFFTTHVPTEYGLPHHGKVDSRNDRKLCGMLLVNKIVETVENNSCVTKLRLDL
jgi:hypothetical protein